MREQKKEPNPAKGSALIGNRFHGNSKIHNAGTVSNTPNYTRILSELKHTMISGESTFQIVVEALQAKFEGVQYENE